MSRNIIIKLLICTMFIILLNSFCVQSSYALGDFLSSGKGFLEAGNSRLDETIDEYKLKQTSDTVYNTLLAIGVIVAVAVAMILGIQFMIASADEKAKVKEAIMPFIVGCVVVFGSFTIWKLVINVGNDAENAIVYHPKAEDVEKDDDTLTGTFVVADFEFKHCDDCGDALTQEENNNDKCTACGALLGFVDWKSTHCGYCGSNNTIIISIDSSAGRIYSNKGLDLYCYNCDIWSNCSASAEKEIRLTDTTSDKVKDKIEAERGKSSIEERDSYQPSRNNQIK